jgi:hypothetical protein
MLLLTLTSANKLMVIFNQWSCNMGLAELARARCAMK